MSIEYVEDGVRIEIGQEFLSFGDLERICTAIDDAIVEALPESATTTQGVLKFILKHYKKRLSEKLVVLSDKSGYQLLKGGKK